MGNFEYSHKPKRYEDMELIFSVGSVINTKNGMVYPLKKASGAILWNEGFNIVDAYNDYDNNYQWFLQIDVFDKKIVNKVLLKLLTKNVKKSQKMLDTYLENVVYSDMKNKGIMI